jgi:uncharacterized delta-60 repeat protein
MLFLFAAFSLTSADAGGLAPDKNFLSPSFAKPVPPERALLLPDGKYLLLFDPDTLTDQAAGPITRYLADGTLDSSFSFSRDYKQVRAAVSAGNGKFYVAATRYVYGTKEIEQILRLNSDGSIDPSFTPAVIASPGDNQNFVWTMYLQPDGKILAGGYFTTVSGIARQNLVRLLSNGSVDTDFAPPKIDGGEVYAITLQPDNKILVGGSFSFVGNNTSLGVTRLTSNGSVDSTFNPAGFIRGSASQRIRAFVVQSDGKIVMAGQFKLTSKGSPAPLLRLNADGSVDATFTLVTNIVNPVGREFVMQSDGKFVATVSSSVYRFNNDGSRDNSFRQPVILDTTVSSFGNPVAGTPVSINALSDGDFLVGGIFTDVDPPGSPNNSHFGVVRINSDGTVDSSLTSSHKTGVEIAPNSFARLADGSTLIGFVDKIDPVIPYNVGRLLSNGSFDPNFTLSSSDPNGFLSGGFTARGFEQLSNGSFFVFGLKPTANALSYGKVSATGVSDTTYASDTPPVFQTATATPDGKVLLAAGTDAQSTVYDTLRRVGADGHLDSFAVPQSIRSGQIFRFDSGQLSQINVGNRPLAVQADGKILFEYFSYEPGFYFHLVRLNADGTVDGSFAETKFTPFDLTESFPVVFDPATASTLQPPGGAWTASLPWLDARIQSDGRLIIAGQFKSFNGTPAAGLVRLNANGTIDNTFNAGSGAQWTQTVETATNFPRVDNVEFQADGKILITGTFEAFNGVAAPGIASLNPDGSVDTSFVAPVAREKYSRLNAALLRQADGSFLLSGPYRFLNETKTDPLIRLINLSPAAVNISTRLGVGTDENVLIEGFIVLGPAGSSKKIMVRAIGPSLSQFGIADALANPTLEIHDANSATVATNNDWKTTQIGGLINGDQFAEINASGVAPTNDLESALIVSLEPGNYTAVVRGAGNTVGTGVVDAFDLDAGSAARLANIATRGLIQPGDKLMIGGFIVQNGSIKTVVRAIGPSLSQFGISNALPDTTLQLRDQQGAIVMENDDWKTSQQQELESTGLQPTHDLEAALVATIQPGQYTAQVRGKGNATGVGVVQVYFLQ